MIAEGYLLESSSMIWDDEIGIGTIEEVLNAAECAEHIDRGERRGFAAAPIVSGYRQVFAAEVHKQHPGHSG